MQSCLIVGLCKRLMVKWVPVLHLEEKSWLLLSCGELGKGPFHLLVSSVVSHKFLTAVDTWQESRVLE